MSDKPPLDAGTVRILREALDQARQRRLDQAQRLIAKGYVGQATEAQHRADGLAEALRLIEAERIKRGTE
jgi:hypothetical protein